MATELGLPFVDLKAIVADPDALAEISVEVAVKYQIVPLRYEGSEMFLAMANPSDLFVLDDIRAETGLRELRIAVAPAADVSATIERLYEHELGTQNLLARLGDAGDAYVQADSGSRVDPFDPRSDQATGPVVALINGILADAVRNRATDIHIEPQVTSVSVRYRVDGLLHEVMKVPKQVQAFVISRLKILAGMNIAERRKPQSGRVTLVVNGMELDARASSIPTFNGEKFVLRLLRTAESPTSLSELGLSDGQRTQVELELLKPQGMMIFTGPTGSGKTSTMYALLNQMKSPHRNIVTLEDPIEYQLEGVNQTQIDEKAGITFASGLRTLLRQDPDVILVGEIRDAETAEIAFHAANTGHLVLTSLHTNDAPAAATRLLDLGVEPYVIAGALSMVVAQRLVRCVCSHCAEDCDLSDEVQSQIVLSSQHLSVLTPRRGKGCAACAYTGYRDRIGVFEVMPVTAEMKDQISTQLSKTNVSHLARTAGVATVRDAALALATAGVTTFEEVLRVTVGDGAVTTSHPGQLFLRPRILVIDDDEASNEAMRRILSDFDVDCATTAEDGLRRATLERPDGIVLDLHLPDASGTDVIRQLRSSVVTSIIPVMMLTGTMDKAVETENLRAGVDDYVTKPVDHETLRMRLDILLRRHSDVKEKV